MSMSLWRRLLSVSTLVGLVLDQDASLIVWIRTTWLVPCLFPSRSSWSGRGLWIPSSIDDWRSATWSVELLRWLSRFAVSAPSADYHLAFLGVGGTRNSLSLRTIPLCISSRGYWHLVPMVRALKVSRACLEDQQFESGLEISKAGLSNTYK